VWLSRLFCWLAHHSCCLDLAAMQILTLWVAALPACMSICNLCHSAVAYRSIIIIDTWSTYQRSKNEDRQLSGVGKEGLFPPDQCCVMLHVWVHTCSFLNSFREWVGSLGAPTAVAATPNYWVATRIRGIDSCVTAKPADRSAPRRNHERMNDSIIHFKPTTEDHY